MTGSSAAAPVAPMSAWAPLRHPLYRALWTAQLVSNIGTWMQNVGAVWLMGSLGGSPAQVALVQSAVTLPVFLTALPAGALADIVDRRRLLLCTQSWMLLSAGALAVLTRLDAVTPEVLLALVFSLGLGTAVNMPAWQAIQPELVPRREFPQAVVLGSASMNIGRAVGPAIGGLLVAGVGTEAVFALNALSFLGIVVVLFTWRRERSESEMPTERLAGAVRAGLRYGRNSPALRAVLIRSATFMIAGSSFLALLPVVARSDLDMSAAGFGAAADLLRRRGGDRDRLAAAAEGAGRPRPAGGGRHARRGGVARRAGRPGVRGGRGARLARRRDRVGHVPVELQRLGAARPARVGAGARDGLLPVDDPGRHGAGRRGCGACWPRRRTRASRWRPRRRCWRLGR